MGFAVAVDIPPVEAAAAARTVATCNAALGPEQCVLAGTRSSDSAARWYAIVRYGRDGRARLTIELYERTPDGSRVASSELEFKERDAPEERWASVGVVVAALVLAQPADREPVPKKAEPPPVARPKAAPAQPAPQPPAWLRLELGLTAGSEMRSAPLRLGPLARLGVAFSGTPVFACTSLAYTVQSSGNLDLSWLSGSLGAGVSVGFAERRLALSLRAEAVLETLGIVASDGARSESARRTRFGPRLGVDLSAYWTKNWAVVVGGEAGVLGPRVVLQVGDRSGELPPFAWGFLSALRYDFR
ncbi:MAG TPA: hypothetical protein VFK05_29850 [Polyangiaceae bacterium]|nr:hypothetical protein [Polyangiaceae bacterium]